MFKIILFLFLLTCTYSSPVSAETASYYRSNSLGMQLEKINRLRILDQEYYLEKQIMEEREIRRLFSGDKLVKEWELVFNHRERLEKEIVREGNKTTERVFDSGTVIREDFYENSSFIGFKKYIYKDGHVLSRIEEYSPAGKLLNYTEYERDYRGNIQLIVRHNFPETGDRYSEISRYRFTGPQILEEWHGTDDNTGVFIFYNTRGLLQRVVEYKAGIEVSEKNYYYTDTVLNRTEEYLFQADEKIVQYYSEKGMVTEEVYYAGSDVSKRIYNYYRDDLLTRRIIRRERDTERYLYFYDPELETPVREEYYLNGRLMKETVFLDENNYYEDLFRRGERYMRIYYRDDEKYRTEKW